MKTDSGRSERAGAAAKSTDAQTRAVAARRLREWDRKNKNLPHCSSPFHDRSRGLPRFNGLSGTTLRQLSSQPGEYAYGLFALARDY